MSTEPTSADIAAELIWLHEFKDADYKDAWRKRGELIGIFANIARKYDRLVVAQEEAHPGKGEPRADTSADLCVYSIKYVTWLIEQDPNAAVAIHGAHERSWSAAHGHDAVAAALEQLATSQPAPPASLDEAFDAIAAPFTTLEEILVHQRETSSQDKAILAWDLARASFAYLWRLALDEPAAWQHFTTYVANPT